MENAPNRGANKLAGSGPKAAAKPTARSAISNGSRLLTGVDGRSRLARRWRDVFRELMSETGGRDEHLCRQAASLIVQRETLDSALARGEPVESLHLVRICGAINRTLARAGLAKAVTAPVDMTAQALDAMRGAP